MKFSLASMIYFILLSAFFFMANQWPRVSEWDKGEHYRCVGYGFPFVCYSRCDMTYPPRMTRSGAAETKVGDANVRVGLAAANVGICLAISVLTAALMGLWGRDINGPRIAVLTSLLVCCVVLNCWARVATTELSLTRTKLSFAAGFPLHFCEEERVDRAEACERLISKGWPHSIPYFKIVDEPRNLFWNMLLCGVSSLAISMAFMRRNPSLVAVESTRAADDAGVEAESNAAVCMSSTLSNHGEIHRRGGRRDPR